MSGRDVRNVTVIYHREDGVWWADSPDMPGFSAAGDSFKETRELAIEGVPFYFDDDIPNILDERMENGARLMSGNVVFLQMPAAAGNSRMEFNRPAEIASSSRTTEVRKLQVA